MPELTNLLPPDRLRMLSHGYLFRLVAVVALATALLIGIHSALLVPSYLYLSEEVQTQKAHLAGLSAAYAGAEGEALSGRHQTLTERAEALLSPASQPTGSALLRSVFAVPHESILITGVTITLPDTGDGQMTIRGVALTRDSLRRYHDALSALPFVTKADLPLSVYATERDISFSIAITGPLRP